MPDTLKAQFTAFLTTGRVLYSDMGRVLCSIVADDCGWHDTISGSATPEAARARFGDGGVPGAAQRLPPQRRATTCWSSWASTASASATSSSNVNFFVRVAVGDDGRARLDRRQQPARARSVELRFEMDTLVVLSNTPHPLDPATRYQPPRVELTVSDGTPAAADDRCRAVAPRERARLRADRGLRHARWGRGDDLPDDRRARSIRVTRIVDVTLPAGPGLDARARARRDLPHRRPRGQPGGRHAVLQRARRRRALQRHRHDPRAGQHLPDHRHAPDVQRGPPAADDRRRHLRPPRHAGRRLLGREQPGALRAGQEVHAQLPRQLPAGAGALRARHDASAICRATSTSS